MRFVLATILLVGPICAASQVPLGADKLTSQAVSDSESVMRELSGVLRANPRDAASWFRRGNVAWALSVRAAAKPSIRTLNEIRLRSDADSSLRLAAQLEPRNAAYQLAIGSFLRLSPDPAARFAAVGFITKAVDAARASPDLSARSRVLIEAGRVYWLRYESHAHQTLLCTLPPSIDSASVRRQTKGDDSTATYLPTEGALKVLHNWVVECHRPSEDLGESDYAQAEALFREAYANDKSARAFRHLSMLLADRDRWRELAAVARDRAKSESTDAWAYLVLGLAMHRAGSSSAARSTLDTGVTMLEARERARLFAFERLLARPDSIRQASRSPADRAAWEESFWSAADPLWSKKGDDPQTEFLARVTFAELRWTVDELGVRGADSDRGEIYIRYGPPDRIVAARGCNAPTCSPGSRVPALLTITSDTMWTAPDRLTATLPGVSDVVSFWDYDNGLTLTFWGAPTYGTARFPQSDGTHIERAIEIRSASFDNLLRDKIVQMPISASRFRAPGDSVDVLVITRAPMQQLREAVANVQIIAHSWLLGQNDDEYADSATVRDNGIARDVYRVSSSRYLYRVEAEAKATNVAGRGLKWIRAEPDSATGFALKGFGVSDVLIATAIQPATRVPVRWRDFNVAPLLGAAGPGSTLELLWENYDLGSRDGQTRYSVSITLQRVRTTAGQLGATLLGFASNAVGVKRGSDRIVLTYERGGPAAPAVFAEHISLALGETPPGDYGLVLEITDRVTGRKAKNETAITISR